MGGKRRGKFDLIYSSKYQALSVFLRVCGFKLSSYPSRYEEQLIILDERNAKAKEVYVRSCE